MDLHDADGRSGRPQPGPCWERRCRYLRLIRRCFTLPRPHGTQFTVTGSEFGPFPIEDPQRLDERRAEAGLEPEGERIARFDAQDDGVTFLAYFLLSPGQEHELTPLRQGAGREHRVLGVAVHAGP